MRTRRWALVAALLGLAWMLAGCGAGAPTPIPTPLPPAPTATAAPDVSAAQAVAQSSKPPPAPDTTAQTVIAAFRAAHLPIGEVTVYPGQQPAPGSDQYVTKATWHDTRLAPPRNPALIEVSDGGAVEFYADAATALAHAQAHAQNAALIASLTESDYGRGPLLLRLSGNLTPAQVDAYTQVVDQLP